MNQCRSPRFYVLFLAVIWTTPLLQAQFVPAAGLEKLRLSARSSASVAPETAEVLRKKGYILIGEITVQGKDTQTVWNTVASTGSFEEPREPEPGPKRQDLVPELLSAAASRGGDLVVVRKNNSLERSPVTKGGKCLRWRIETDWDTSYNPSPHRVKVSRPICEEQAVLSGYKWYVESSGTVWRMDAGLVRAIDVQRNRLASARQLNWPEGLRPVQTNGKYGYVNASGQTVIEPRFDHAWGFSEGLARVKIGEKLGWIDTAGTVVIQLQFDAAREFKEGLAFVGRGELFDWKWACIDKSGKIVMDYKFDDAETFSEGLAPVAIGHQEAVSEKLTIKVMRWGYIDKSGGWIIQPAYDDALEFSEGVAPVEVNRKWGYINKEAQFSIKPKFYEAYPFSDGLAVVGVEGKHGTSDSYGFIDKTGQWAIKPQFEKADPFQDGMAAVKHGKWRLIGKDGSLDPTDERNDKAWEDFVESRFKF